MSGAYPGRGGVRPGSIERIPMTESPLADPHPEDEPDTEPKPGVNDPNPEGTGSDEPLTPL
jgi:hypothetical protein